jgi:hypothetical protein
MDSLAEFLSKIELDIPNIVAKLAHNCWDVRFAALDVIGKLVKYRE